MIWTDEVRLSSHQHRRVESRQQKVGRGTITKTKTLSSIRFYQLHLQLTVKLKFADAIN